MTSTAELTFDPAAEMTGPDFRANPYPLYARMRRETPVYRSSTGIWYLTRHPDIEAGLADPRLSNDRDRMTRALGLGGEQARNLSRLNARLGLTMANTDAPEHSRLRRLVSRAFTARRVEELRERVQAVVDGLLDAAGPAPEIIEALASPLPNTVICEVFGIPEADRERVRVWFRVLSNLMADVDRSEAVVEEFHDYLSWLVGVRRHEPGDDVLSALVAAQARGDQLTDDEVLSTCFLLITAGDETTTHLIGNGVLALLRHPEQLALLRAQPELIRAAVDECVRYDTPTQAFARVVAEDVPLRGQVLPEGEMVYLLLASANRDPERYTDPGRFDISRSGTAHVGFGHGPHFCLGASLARLEAEIAIGTLVRRSPGLRLATDDLRWRENPLQRRLTALPIIR